MTTKPFPDQKNLMLKLVESNKHESHQTNNAFKGNLEMGHKRGKNFPSEMNCSYIKTD